jgi:hypothetical protein
MNFAQLLRFKSRRRAVAPIRALAVHLSAASLVGSLCAQPVVTNLALTGTLDASSAPAVGTLVYNTTAAGAGATAVCGLGVSAKLSAK